MAATAGNADAIVGGDNVVCDERVLAAAKKFAGSRSCPQVSRNASARQRSIVRA
jgi:hypothetical protein